MTLFIYQIRVKNLGIDVQKNQILKAKNELTTSQKKDLAHLSSVSNQMQILINYFVKKTSNKCGFFVCVNFDM